MCVYKSSNSNNFIMNEKAQKPDKNYLGIYFNLKCEILQLYLRK